MLLEGKPEDKRDVKTVADLWELFHTEYALPRYRNADGRPNAEVDCFRSLARLLVANFGNVPVDKFRALALRELRKEMIAAGWSRKWINKQVGRVRLMFRVGASLELVDPETVASLKTLPALMPFESNARETEPRKGVTAADLKAVRAVMPQGHRDIFDLLLLTGARPGEILGLTTGLIEREGDVWRSDLKNHKNMRRGKSRVLFFSAPAQAILWKYLTLDPDRYLFSMRPSSFSGALKRHCLKAGVPHFVPHQLRHTVATILADDLGLEAAQRVLGHSELAMSAHYSLGAEKQAKLAVAHLQHEFTANVDSEDVGERVNEGADARRQRRRRWNGEDGLWIFNT